MPQNILVLFSIFKQLRFRNSCKGKVCMANSNTRFHSIWFYFIWSVASPSSLGFHLSPSRTVRSLYPVTKCPVPIFVSKKPERTALYRLAAWPALRSEGWPNVLFLPPRQPRWHGAARGRLVTGRRGGLRGPPAAAEIQAGPRPARLQPGGRGDPAPRGPAGPKGPAARGWGGT